MKRHIKYYCLFIVIIVGNLNARQWCYNVQQKYCIDFDTSMDFKKEDEYSKVRITLENDPITQFCRSLYVKNNMSHLHPQKHALIPKIAHIIWVGPKTPPPVFSKCIESIKKHLPTWELKIWTDKDLPSLTLENQQFYDEETNYGAKADILRYELLYKFGGVYLDIDFVLTQPLDILNHTYEFYTCLLPSSTPVTLGNALIGTVPGHRIMRDCIDEIGKRKNRKRKSIPKRTGPNLFQKSFFRIAQDLPTNRIIALPRTFFYPLEMHETTLSADAIRPETFAVHYWAASWSKELSEGRRTVGGDHVL